MTYFSPLPFPKAYGPPYGLILCGSCGCIHHLNASCWAYSKAMDTDTDFSFELQKLRHERDLLKLQLKESNEKRALIEEIEELKKKVKG